MIFPEGTKVKISKYNICATLITLVTAQCYKQKNSRNTCNTGKKVTQTSGGHFRSAGKGLSRIGVWLGGGAFNRFVLLSASSSSSSLSDDNFMESLLLAFNFQKKGELSIEDFSSPPPRYHLPT